MPSAAKSIAQTAPSGKDEPPLAAKMKPPRVLRSLSCVVVVGTCSFRQSHASASRGLSVAPHVGHGSLALRSSARPWKAAPQRLQRSKSKLCPAGHVYPVWLESIQQASFVK